MEKVISKNKYDSQLLYEGEYLNCKKNGKKEYYNNKSSLEYYKKKGKAYKYNVN